MPHLCRKQVSVVWLDWNICISHPPPKVQGSIRKREESEADDDSRDTVMSDCNGVVVHMDWWQLSSQTKLPARRRVSGSPAPCWGAIGNWWLLGWGGHFLEGCGYMWSIISSPQRDLLRNCWSKWKIMFSQVIHANCVNVSVFLLSRTFTCQISIVFGCGWILS